MQIHETTIFDVQDQTLTLLKSSQSLVERIRKNKELHVKDGLIEEHYLADAVSILENEYQKANELEMVIAVVGTMKAGKSTTINAIVGHEVLPNRNYPMTALPTVVTHISGKKIPSLEFSNSKPINNLSKKIAEKIDNMSSDEINDIDFLHHKEVEDLISELKTKGQLELNSRYEGQEQIFEFLKSLNDIMRLAKELRLEPPYEAYRLIDDLPTIEVEFQHLSDLEKQSHGKLSIIDTPGPNEYGQSEKLKAIFKDQLQKASAVLLVVDYTQMNSEAGGDVREEISTVQGSLGERFFVMLNKFDAKTKNDVSQEDTVSFFCNQLMDGNVKAENVFPVSAQRAFLANRAINELDSNGTLNVKDDWVPDFGEIAFGEDWEEDIEDAEDVRKKAKKIWKKAGFEAPLENVVMEASNNAATLSLESALTQLETIHNRLNEGINGYKEAINTNIDSLRVAIKNIESDKLKIDSVQKQTQTLIVKHTQEMNTAILALAKATIQMADKKVQLLFDDTQNNIFLAKKEQAKIESNEGVQNVDLSRIVSKLFGRRSANNPTHRLESLITEGEIKFEKSEKAEMQKLLKFINSALETIQQDAYKEVSTNLNKTITQAKNAINKSISSELEDVLNEAKKNLKDSGFTLSLSLNKISTSIKNIDAEAISTDVKRTSESRRRSRVKDSTWSKFTNFLNDDWGRETYYVDVDVYIVKVDDIKKRSSDAISTAMQGISETANSFLSESVKPNIDAHIAELSSYLEKYRKTLLAGAKAKEQSQKNQEILIKKLNDFGTELQHIAEDTIDSKEDLNLTQEELTS